MTRLGSLPPPRKFEVGADPTIRAMHAAWVAQGSEQFAEYPADADWPTSAEDLGNARAAMYGVGTVTFRRRVEAEIDGVPWVFLGALVGPSDGDIAVVGLTGTEGVLFHGDDIPAGLWVYLAMYAEVMIAWAEADEHSMPNLRVTVDDTPRDLLLEQSATIPLVSFHRAWVRGGRQAYRIHGVADVEMCYLVGPWACFEEAWPYVRARGVVMFGFDPPLNSDGYLITHVWIGPRRTGTPRFVVRHTCPTGTVVLFDGADHDYDCDCGVCRAIRGAIAAYACRGVIEVSVS